VVDVVSGIVVLMAIAGLVALVVKNVRGWKGHRTSAAPAAPANVAGAVPATRPVAASSFAPWDPTPAVPEPTQSSWSTELRHWQADPMQFTQLLMTDAQVIEVSWVPFAASHGGTVGVADWLATAGGIPARLGRSVRLIGELENGTWDPVCPTNIGPTVAADYLLSKVFEGDLDVVESQIGDFLRSCANGSQDPRAREYIERRLSAMSPV
jgi:hypothetical protein